MLTAYIARQAGLVVAECLLLPGKIIRETPDGWVVIHPGDERTYPKLKELFDAWLRSLDKHGCYCQEFTKGPSPIVKVYSKLTGAEGFTEYHAELHGLDETTITTILHLAQLCYLQRLLPEVLVWRTVQSEAPYAPVLNLWYDAVSVNEEYPLFQLMMQVIQEKYWLKRGVSIPTDTEIPPYPVEWNSQTDYYDSYFAEFSTIAEHLNEIQSCRDEDEADADYPHGDDYWQYGFDFKLEFEPRSEPPFQS